MGTSDGDADGNELGSLVGELVGTGVGGLVGTGVGAGVGGAVGNGVGAGVGETMKREISRRKVVSDRCTSCQRHISRNDITHELAIELECMFHHKSRGSSPLLKWSSTTQDFVRRWYNPREGHSDRKDNRCRRIQNRR